MVQHAADHIDGGTTSPSFLSYDAGLRRLMLGRPASGRSKGLIAISLETGKIKPLGVGSSAALAVDADDNKVFVALADVPQIIVLDRKSLQRIDTILLNTPAATLVYDAADHLLIAGAAGQALVWIIDARQHVIADSLVLSGASSSCVFDPSTDRAYLGVASADSVDVIDPVHRTVAAFWQLAPSFAPQSLALGSNPHQLAVGGSRGSMACLDPSDGKILGVASVPAGPGIVASELSSGRVVYACAATGAAAIYGLVSGGPPSLATQFSVPAGASAIAALSGQAQECELYVAFAGSGGTYLQRFTLPAP